MGEESPAEMKRFGMLADALRVAGSMPLRYPRRGDIATVANYVNEALEPFTFDEVRLVRPDPNLLRPPRARRRRERSPIQVGPAHTPGDLIVWVPDARVAIAADILFIGVTPIMWAGPLARWVAALERLLEMEQSALFPAMVQSVAPTRYSA